jgi:hypothetical protein
MTFGMTFFSDEWAFIADRSLTDPSTWWAPHNEHWVTLPMLAYRLLVETVGIGSYVPYAALVIALHLVIATFVYAMLERACGVWPALAGAVVILFLGSGFENLFWGFQVTFLASLVFGLAALWLLDGPPSIRRGLAIALLLLASIASSGMGAVMAVAVGVEWILRREWRRTAWLLAIPAAGYLVWLVTSGSPGVSTFGDPLDRASITAVPATVVRGVANGVSAVLGLPGLEVLVLIPAIAVVGWVIWRRRHVPVRFVALLAAVIALYVLTGLTRSGLFAGIIEYTRYTYVSAILVLLAFGSLIGKVTIPATRVGRLTTVAVVGTWMAFALVTNIGLLVLGRELFLGRADLTRALVTVAIDPARPAGVDGARSLVFVPPSPDRLREIVARYGDPRADRLVPGSVRAIPPEILAEARRRLVEGAPVPSVGP